VRGRPGEIRGGPGVDELAVLPRDAGRGGLRGDGATPVRTGAPSGCQARGDRRPPPDRAFLHDNPRSQVKPAPAPVDVSLGASRSGREAYRYA
jgi:hypothetical protein